MPSSFLQIAAAILIVVSASQAGSQPVSPAETTPSPKQFQAESVASQALTPDQQGTIKSPLVVDVRETNHEAAERAAAERHRAREAANSRFGMYFAGGAMLVGLFQLVLFYWQLQLMQASVRDTETAAKAAELNARAAIGIELPILRVIPPDLLSTNDLIGGDGPYSGSVNDKAPSRYSAIGLFSIKNFGRTPAFPEEIAVGWAVTNNLPKTPSYIRRTRLNHASVIKPEEEFTANVHYGIELSEDEIKAAASSEAWLWVYGCMYYTDFLQSKREAKFCWRFANRNVGSVFYHFASDGEPPQTYTHGF
jgi:hypothetical protein